jgi:hypothetical protein
MNRGRHCENHWRWTPHSRADGLIEYSMRVSGLGTRRHQKCEQLGFKRGTPEHINCGFEQAHQAAPRGGEQGQTSRRRACC